MLYLNADLPNATRAAHLRNPGGRIMEPRMPGYEKGKRPVMELLMWASNEVYNPQRVIESVVLDPFGELHRRLMEESSDRAVRPHRNLYGDASTYMERFCRHMCEAPVNFVIVCHEITMSDGDGELLRIPFTGTQGGSPTLGAKLMQMVDIIGYCGVAEGEDGGPPRYLTQLVTARGRFGGDRFGVLAPDGQARELDIATWIAEIEAAEKSGVLPTPGAAAVSQQTLQQVVQARPAEDEKEEAPAGAGVRSGTKRKAGAR